MIDHAYARVPAQSGVIVGRRRDGVGRVKMAKRRGDVLVHKPLRIPRGQKRLSPALFDHAAVVAPVEFIGEACRKSARLVRVDLKPASRGSLRSLYRSAFRSDRVIASAAMGLSSGIVHS